MGIHADSRDNAQRLFDIAVGQGGLFTARQAREAGYYYRLQTYHRQVGTWMSEGRGIFRLRNYPYEHPHEDLIKWSLWSHDRKGVPQIVFSDLTALAYYNLGDFNPAKLHVTVPASFRKRFPEGFVVRRGMVMPGDYRENSGFRVTTPRRTCIDALQANAYDDDHLYRALVDAVSRGLVGIDDLRAGVLTSEMKGMVDAVDRRIRERMDRVMRRPRGPNIQVGNGIPTGA